MAQPKRAPLPRDAQGGFRLRVVDGHRADQQRLVSRTKDRIGPICHGAKGNTGEHRLSPTPAFQAAEHQGTPNRWNSAYEIIRREHPVGGK